MWFLLDFNASRLWTHHWSHLRDFYFLAQRIEASPRVFLPRNVDPEVAFNFSNCLAVLNSPSFGYSKNESFINWIRDKVISRLLDCKWPNENKKLFLLLRKVCMQFYRRKSFESILDDISRNPNSILIIPNADPLSLELILDLYGRQIFPKLICIRMTGGENYGPFASSLLLSTFIRLVNNDDCSIRIGWESPPYEEFLIRSGLDSKKIFWAPPPSIPKEFNQGSNYDGEKGITLGFLGNARPNKGFEEIPDLLESLVEKDVHFKAIIQEAKFPWPNYRNTLEKMERFKHSIMLISPDQKEEELEAIMRRVDICVLPYNPALYKLQSSAIVYRAADLGIPVIARKGVAFADEILTHGIGEVYNSASEFPNAVKNVLGVPRTCAISEYNRKRTNAAERFLGMN